MKIATRILLALAVSALLATAARATETGYSIGLNFGADAPNGGQQGGVAPADAAGIPVIKQKNWNNYVGPSSAAPEAIVADNAGVSTPSSATVEWASPNLWASTGWGEENSGFAAGSPDRALMLGYLDTGDNTTTEVRISNLPSQLTGTGYNVYVYALGGVAGRGGNYRVTDSNGTPLKPWKHGDSPANPSAYAEDLGAGTTDQGTYLVFKGLSAANIIVVASTDLDENGVDPGLRAPINAIQVAPAPDTLFINDATADPTGYTVVLSDSGRAVADLTKITLTIDGGPVTPTSATKDGEGVSTITYKVPTPPLVSGSTHTVNFAIKDTLNRDYAKDGSVTVPAYTIIPAADALAEGVINKSNPGFIWRVHQTALGTPTLPTTIARTISQLNGDLGANVADPAAQGPASGPGTSTGANTPVEFVIPTVINLSQAAGENNGNFGNDEQMPGIPGTSVDNVDNNIAAEVLAALEFPTAGLYRIVVNSDDGFATGIGSNPRDLAKRIGFFDAGRGAADTVMLIWVEAPGVYACSTVWQEGGGGANIELLSRNADGSNALLNGTEPTAIKAYQLPTSVVTGTLPAYVRSTTPSPGFVSISRPKTIEAVLVDAGTQVDTGNISLKLNGQDAAVTANKVNGVTTVKHTIVGDLLPSTEYTAELTFNQTGGKAARTVTWNFRTGALSSTIFVVEIEDFDYAENGVSGLTNPKKSQAGQDVDVMPYYGGAYQDLGGQEPIDFVNNDGFDSDVYRTEAGEDGDHEVNLNDNIGGTPGNGLDGTIPVAGSDRGAWTVTANYKLGWVETGSWQNYTRTIPENANKGWWNVYAALSYGGAGAGQLAASLAKVTSGVGTVDQVTEALGTFGASGSGDWGRNNLVPMKTASGAMAAVKLIGKTTLRFNLGSGDSDFFLLSMATPPPPFVDSQPVDSVKRNEVVVDWTIKDTDSKVVASSIKLYINGALQSAKANKVTITDTDTGASVHFDDTGTMYDAGEPTWRIEFSDDSNPQQNVVINGTFVVNPYPTEGVFDIEAEDFNYADGTPLVGGKTNPQKGVAGMDVDVMPYNGGAYDTLSAIEGVDFNNDDAADSDFYRTEVDSAGNPFDDNNEVNIAASNGNRYSNDRGVFDLPNNYKIGWTGGGSWQNYTRTFPTGDFRVWAALSYDGRGAGQLNGSLALVTGNPSQASGQNPVNMGSFNAPGSAGWSRNELVPMKDAQGNIATVTMGGVQTVRFNLGSGDFDYLLFVPQGATPVTPVVQGITLSGGNITVQYDGTLQSAPAVTGPWTDVTGATSPYSTAASAAQAYFRSRQ